MAEEFKWYVVHTYSGYENKVAQDLKKVVENRKLHHLINSTSIPTEMGKIIDDNGREKEAELKVYPGYVFINMILTDESWLAVRNIRGCTGFVGPGSKPVPLSDKEVANMGIEKTEADEQTEIVVNFNVGDMVKITGGTMEGFVGKVNSIDKESHTVDVSVSMFGRETPATLDLKQVCVVDE